VSSCQYAISGKWIDVTINLAKEFSTCGFEPCVSALLADQVTSLLLTCTVTL